MMPGAKSDLVEKIWRRIDEANAEDPRRVTHEGVEMAFEHRHALLASEWAAKLRPSASDELLIAARGQHVLRWTSPRASYPMDKVGYLLWREELKKMHAETLAGFMREESAPEESIDRVRDLVMKKRLRSDPETQTLEDALCITFLLTEFSTLRASTDPEKFKVIVQKTWKKMSAAGRATALELPLSNEDFAVVKAALAEKNR